ncbi:MAG: nicotinate-nucleotide adenylyltransferase [Selenomonas sp.]|uniref:nicotinate-nucleotide adenylyltransferase n=1 Tax=Selenomonas sp. TaxID=2053611 RepID=UPI0025E11D27|nr:nicotinate-nucleotide adenylyltransferase [Selenomonas sp.]MCR5437916.1 nicotinate-nucleotide adenylyltransferase [Selenomonas sp.]
MEDTLQPIRRIGIMGGTFDPIHMAHLAIAEQVREAFALDLVLFIPAANPPHKQGRKVAPAYHRLMMTQLATYSNSCFHVSKQELERTGPSYSLLTVREVQEKYGADAELYFITGSDTINELHTWYHIEELLDSCHFVGTTRPGAPVDKEDLVKRFGRLAEEKIHFLAVPELEISSTDIRQRVRCGKSIKYLVPAAVEAYIRKEGLYQ